MKRLLWMGVLLLVCGCSEKEQPQIKNRVDRATYEWLVYTNRTLYENYTVPLTEAFCRNVEEIHFVGCWPPTIVLKIRKP